MKKRLPTFFFTIFFFWQGALANITFFNDTDDVTGDYSTESHGTDDTLNGSGTSSYRTESYTTDATLNDARTSGYSTESYTTDATLNDSRTSGYSTESYTTDATLNDAGTSRYSTESYTTDATLNDAGTSRYSTDDVTTNYPNNLWEDPELLNCTALSEWRTLANPKTPWHLTSRTNFLEGRPDFLPPPPHPRFPTYSTNEATDATRFTGMNLTSGMNNPEYAWSTALYNPVNPATGCPESDSGDMLINYIITAVTAIIATLAVCTIAYKIKKSINKKRHRYHSVPCRTSPDQSYEIVDEWYERQNPQHGIVQERQGQTGRGSQPHLYEAINTGEPTAESSV